MMYICRVSKESVAADINLRIISVEIKRMSKVPKAQSEE